MEKVNLKWSEFKNTVINQGLRIQYIDRTKYYQILSNDGLIVFETLVNKTDPASSDQQDFEDNFQSISNTQGSQSGRTMYENIDGILNKELDSEFIYENKFGFSNIGLLVSIPTGGQVSFQGTFDGTEWFSISFRGIESNTFTSSIDTSQNVIGSIAGLRKIKLKVTIAGSDDGSVKGRAQQQQAVIKGIEHQADAEIGASITQKFSSTITYVGKAEDVNAETGEAKWQIKRIETVLGITRSKFASNGKYNQIFNNASTIFGDSSANESLYCAEFDGVDEFITTDSPGISGLNARTISLWVKVISGGTQYFVSYGSAASLQEFNLGMETDKIIALFNGSNHKWTANGIGDGEWHHVVFVYDTAAMVSNALCYMDGSPLSTSSIVNGIAVLNTGTDSNVLLATLYNGSSFANIRLDEVSIWGAALSSTEIAEIYNSGKPNDLGQHSRSEVNRNWWRFDSSSPPVVPDSGPAGEDGQMVNMEAGDIKEDAP